MPKGNDQSKLTLLIAPLIAAESRLEGKVQKRKSIYASAICIAIMALVVWGSVWQGYYNYDPHHWGLMLSNAKDLYDGKLPYQEIFIQYGFLTTAIHAIAYGWFGGNLTSIITATAIAYATGLWLIYRATLSLTGNIKIALYVFVTCFLIHPIAIYPWSNYIAFPFIVYGILALTTNHQDHRGSFLAGISFGLAILSREGVAPAIILLLSFSTLLNLVWSYKDRKNSLTSASLMALGLLLPIVIFFLYLAQHGLISYWYKLSWLLPQIYAKTLFPHVSGFAIFNELLKAIWNGLISLDYRWLLLGMVIAVNLFLIILIVVRRKLPYLTSGVANIAFGTLLLLSGSLHIAEIFRLATGSVIGVITFYVVLDHYKQANWIFILVLCALGSTLVWSNTGNYFLPYRYEVESYKDVETTSVFKGQRWSKSVIQYYQNIDSNLQSIANSQCGIAFHYNSTDDAFLQVLSPFSQYQVAPFGSGPFGENNPFDNLRQDFDLRKKLDSASDMVVFLHLPEKEFSSYQPPEGYFVYRHYAVPTQRWFSFGNSLLILVPYICRDPLHRLDG